MNYEQEFIRQNSIVKKGIITAEYDALCENLDLLFLPEGQVWRFHDVPEHVWYKWRSTEETQAFFCACILGKYSVKRIENEMN